MFQETGSSQGIEPGEYYSQKYSLWLIQKDPFLSPYFLPIIFIKQSSRPRHINAPGASIINLNGSKDAPNNAIGFSYNVIAPVPNISLTLLIAIRDRVNPMPMPNPSAMERTGPFLQAKASARPSTIQFTTIKGIKIPSFKNKGYVYACIKSSTIVTKVAMITIKHGILTLAGIIFLKQDTKKFEKTRTNVTASPMPIPFANDFDTARVGHNPRTILKGGISVHNHLVNSFAMDFAITSNLLFNLFHLI
jgi:hypothetical protein